MTLDKIYFQIITEKIDINESEVLEVDQIILMEMKERLNPPKRIDYSNYDWSKENHELEKKMRGNYE